MADDPAAEGPVTVQVSRRIRPGHESDYETWVHATIEAARGFSGYLGASVLRPSAQTAGRYVLIYRFATWAQSEAWESSADRARRIDALAPLVEGETARKRVTGLETWFDLPEIPAAAQAPRWKMALVLTGVVFGLVFPLQVCLGPQLAEWPAWLRSLTIVVIQVLLMTYAVMPRVTALLKPWLFRA